jgi:hypothetical protein
MSYCVQATWDDVPHLAADQKQKLWDAIPPHQRDARTKGIPVLGSGRIFTEPEEKLVCEPFEIPKHYAQIIGLDFGMDHPFAAARLAWDKDADCIYLTHSYRESGQLLAVEASSVRKWGDWIPCAWPHDGLRRDKRSGDEMASQYGAEGLNMLPEHATHEAGGNGVEAGVNEMIQRMSGGRFKVFRGNDKFFEEYRLYHRKDGLIVKLMDDLISAVRYGIMMRRFAEPEPDLKFGEEFGGFRGGRSWMGT